MERKVTFNVGGTKFETKLSTIYNVPEHMLASLVSDLFNPSGPATEYFIDREPNHFRFILNYLRDGAVVLPISLTKLYQLLLEAEFYQIKPLIKLIEDYIRDMTAQMSQVLIITRTKTFLYFEGSARIFKHMTQNFDKRVVSVPGHTENGHKRWRMLSPSSRYFISYELVSSVIAKLSEIGLQLVGTSLGDGDENYYMESEHK